ncbi:hypothetical protein ABT072_28750 [Streptomyces sp. NPDC002589]|uniref:hypothetical protein n=1 Tax=Streptomyces sp. NPDC002589 TaxID=3154420 RepID=UPI0033216F7A
MSRMTDIQVTELMRDRLRTLAEERGMTITELVEWFAVHETTRHERERAADEVSREPWAPYPPGFWKDNLDAIAVTSDGQFWIFKGDLCVGTTASECISGPREISEVWPVTTGTVFDRDLDAVMYRPDGYWFFKGDWCAQSHIARNAWVNTPMKITTQWSMLKYL